jgi:flagellin
MRINNNLMAMNTHRQMGITASSQTKSMEKLSSGYRINRAGDDAAGLAISEKMRAQIKGLNQASRNSQDAISLVQTAEGALNETQNILQRMRELAVQSANDTNVDADRTAIQNEIDQLTTEIDRIGNTTEFNTRKLLNGGAGITGTSTNTDISIVGGTADTTVVNGGTMIFTNATTATSATTTLTTVDATDGDITVNGTTLTFADAGDAAANGTALRALLTSHADALGVTISGTGTDVIITNNDVGSSSNLIVNAATIEAGATADNVFGADATAGTVTVAGGVVTGTTSASGNVVTVHGGSYDGLQVKVVADGTATLSVTANGSLSMQIGANEGQDLNVSFNDMRASALGVSAVDITSAASAKTSITTINTAITAVSDERAKLGAVQNRLEHTIANLDTSAENLQASESRIRDVDMAKEMMEFTKNNILQQAAQSMLAQANQAPQGVLQLLR